MKYTVTLLTALLLSPLAALAQNSATGNQSDLLGIVTRFADAMIDRSRTNLPNAQLPLFPIVLTRDTYQVPAIGARSLVTARVPQRGMRRPKRERC